MRLHVYAMPENATDILPGSRGIRFVKSRGKQVGDLVILLFC